ncbi:MAG: hypothetical protein KJP21_06715 [Bacteroidia bacterium]|nr:hypothetical protein [Bacteroidia bacterium]NNJ56762.1 hypothetical protein [Bacteroidia bacterium]
MSENISQQEEFSFQENLLDAFQSFGEKIADAIPRIIMVVVLLVAGYLVAKIIATFLEKGLKAVKFDDLAVKLKLDEPMKVVGIKGGLSKFLSKVVFWLIMLVIIVSASENLGIAIIAEQINKIIEFIPKLISAVLILLAGYFVAVKIKEVINNMTESLGGSAGRVIASVVYYFIMIMVIITAIDQTGIRTSLISNNILLVVAVILIGGAVAYGYAAREIMRNMLSSFYSKKNFYEGQRIKIGDLEGTILAIDNTSVTLQTETTKVIMPATELVSNNVEILEE